MINRKYTKTIIGIMVLSLLPLCKEKTIVKEKTSMIITFVSGDVKILRKDEKGNISEIPAKMGMLVYEEDMIRTEKGKIDLQTKTGSSIRIKEMTSLNVKSITSDSGGETNLEMDHGNMIANIEKATSKEEFKVATPTAIAGVRGTTFTVEVDPFEKTSSVKVLEGKVSLKPRVVLLEKVSAEEIEKNQELKNLKELEKKEVIVEENQEAQLDPSIEKKIIQINEKAEKEDINQILKTEEVQDLSKSAEKVEKITKVENIQPTPDLIVEKETMITLNQEEIKQIEEGKNTHEILLKKQEERKVKEEEVIKKIESLAESKKLKSENEIKKYYNNSIVLLKI